MHAQSREYADKKGTNDVGLLPMSIVSLLTLKTISEDLEGNQSSPKILHACTPVYLKNDCKKESNKQSLRFSPGTAKKTGIAFEQLRIDISYPGNG